ncbi:LysR substrate-binding domain-containing protein [Erwiniaceae bacterium L1_54_6]|nr:LysR substrate-binding domain-containing protein [Erwiniaceae bacterium L1_54_6]
MELLNDMALFVEVAKAMSFSRAAEVLGIPGSTLSRRISQLEKAIGLRLLHRTTRKVELTEAGQLYYERCKRIVDEARLIHEQLGDMLEQPEGVLRVSLPVDFAAIFVSPLLAEFAGLYPGIQFELDLTPRRADLISEGIDVAIRIGEPAMSNLIARKLMQFHGQLFASPAYLAGAKELTHPDDLSQHQCIGFLKNTRWTLLNANQRVTIDCRGRFMLNNVGMMRKLALMHQGIIFVPPQAIKDDLAARLLVPVLPEWRGEATAVYALTETRLLPAKTQRFLDFIRDKLRSINNPI